MLVDKTKFDNEMQRATAIQKKAIKMGFKWDDDAGFLSKCAEELAEVADAIKSGDVDVLTGEIGDLLFSAMLVATYKDVSAEDALKQCNDKFELRFAYMYDHLKAQGVVFQSATLDQYVSAWQKAKKSGL